MSVFTHSHLGFGTVLGPDKKPLKTRSGANFKLMDLLQAAVDRGTEAVTVRAAEPHAPTHGLPEAELAAISSQMLVQNFSLQQHDP